MLIHFIYGVIFTLIGIPVFLVILDRLVQVVENRRNIQYVVFVVDYDPAALTTPAGYMPMIRVYQKGWSEDEIMCLRVKKKWRVIPNLFEVIQPIVAFESLFNDHYILYSVSYNDWREIEGKIEKGEILKKVITYTDPLEIDKEVFVLDYRKI
ncbi:hypothetical protein LCGC14_0194820 [marine sediment metagenome]|uniref:Uncharacterized protein n=1 Tax=marine sediment metagenome TaxID=412755 RepID=A0A0F9UK70_9ZZZZ